MTIFDTIARLKRALVAQAKSLGYIPENFWQKEFRKLMDQHTLYVNPKEDEALFAFSEWAENFDLSQLNS